MCSVPIHNVSWSFTACFSVSLCLSRKRSSFLQERPTAAFLYSFSSLFRLRSRRMMRLRLICIHVFFDGFFPAHMTVSFCVHTLLVSWSFSARVSVSLFRKINFLFSFSFPPQNEEEEGETDIGSDWPLIVVYSWLSKLFFLQLNNRSKINGQWSNYRQLWSKDSHWQRQMRRANKPLNARKSNN